ncbi:Gfo/Idh/MocA family oxidoreductase [Amnibacterium sp. CER49]|uniref:Gfo/Idh/MocA family protein n=1 Tax=Amnibacterium sp. CER49 TaxID=3039161 RepID=UPI0024479D38|nr:Gfo/Idh/MocA family oxidoreductase [Amnibacterium sp. CER49]MDH2442855.1 Gfo/Idh/MocA family oxidoreductase [Amnibacterium sp. CER49]
MQSRIRIGVLGGAGEAAEGHIRGFQADPRAEVLGIWDVNHDAAVKRAADARIPEVHDTLESLLASDVDAVVVCTPDHLHAEHVTQALQAGKHVLCEKPAATNRDDVAGLVRLVRETGLTFLAGNNYHFRPDYRALVEAYRNGDIGKAWLAEGDYVSNLQAMYGASGRTPWRSDSRNPQNILLGGGVHPMGLMLWALQDEAVEVMAYSNHLSEPVLPIDDCYVMIIKFKGGAIGRITAAAGSRGHVPDGGHIALRGTAGSLWGGKLYRDDEHRGHPAVVERDFEAETADQPPRVTDTIQVHYWAEQAEHFLDCIEGKAKPLTSVEDAGRIVATLAAGVESARTGKPVAVDNNF